MNLIKRIFEGKTEQRFTKVLVNEHDLDFFLPILKTHDIDFVLVGEEPSDEGIIVEFLSTKKQKRKVIKDVKTFKVRIRIL